MYREARIKQGELLVSMNGRYKAILDESGNFLLYLGRKVLWETNTTGKGYQLVMRKEADLILFDRDGNQIWSSNNTLPADYLICQDDGNLVLFNNDGKPVWGTNIAQSCFFISIFF